MIDLLRRDLEALRDQLRQQRALIVEAEARRAHQQLGQEVRLHSAAALEQGTEDYELLGPLGAGEMTQRFDHLQSGQRRIAMHRAKCLREQDGDIADHGEPIEHLFARHHADRPQQPNQTVAAKSASFAKKRIAEQQGDFLQDGKPHLLVENRRSNKSTAQITHHSQPNQTHNPYTIAISYVRRHRIKRQLWSRWLWRNIVLPKKGSVLGPSH